MFDLGMRQCKTVSQLFYKEKDKKLTLIVAKVVDDIKAAGVENNAHNFLNYFDTRVKLGTINLGPGKLRFFGIIVTQHDDLAITTDADDKLQNISEYPISRHRRE